MYGIPNMKLDKKAVVLRRARADGSRKASSSSCNTEVGKDYPAEKLLEEFDAIVLCTGATKPRDLPIEGRNLKGVHFAMEFLTANTKSLLDRPSRTAITSRAKGKDVIVIGGGDTGTDCVGTSMRHGCKSLVQVEILPQAAAWNAPRTIRGPNGRRFTSMDYGQEEAAAKFGDDPRVYLTTAKKFIGDDNGHVKGVHTVEIKWDKERQRPVRAQGSCRHGKSAFPRNCSVGDGLPRAGTTVARWLGVERDPRTNVKAEHGKYQTNIPKVFAAGDCRRGQSLVVWAFNEGRGAARECDRFLMGATDLP